MAPFRSSCAAAFNPTPMKRKKDQTSDFMNVSWGRRNVRLIWGAVGVYLLSSDVVTA